MSNQFSFDDLERRIKTINGKLSSENVTVEGAKVREKIQNLYLWQHMDLQKWLFGFTLIFTSLWSFFIVVLLYIKACWSDCGLSDTVLRTLLRTTFGTVVGLPYIASRHFFPKRK